MGCIYKPKKSPYWWIKYYVNGVPQYESTRTTRKDDARRVLKNREGRVANGEPTLPRVDRILYDEAARDLRNHYTTTGARDTEEAEWRLQHLDGCFAGRRVASITSADVTDYAAKRQASGAANATINRELAVLGRMLRLAHENGKLLRVPVIRKLKEAPPREGFFEREPYAAVRAHLPPELRLAVEIAYTYGWRMRSEVLALQLRHVDFEAGTVRLDPGMTKNADGRVVYLTAELRESLAAHIARVRALERATGRLIPHVFPHFTNGRRYVKGDPVRDFRKAWASACREAGVPGMLRHDFRRTAVRNMVNAGVPERVAMSVTGHRTRAVFDRYHIVSPGDLREATRRLEAAGAGAGSVKPTVIPARGART